MSISSSHDAMQKKHMPAVAGENALTLICLQFLGYWIVCYGGVREART
jgi:hypothetical protein